MITPATYCGLPPNLVSDEPNQSFLIKGSDLMMAALSSELGFLSTPVNYVEHVEMGNQAINSMALISARYTLEAADVLAQLVATHLGAVCQALDLRVMQYELTRELRPVFGAAFGVVSSVTLEKLWLEFTKSLDSTANFDSADRIECACKSIQRHLADANDADAVATRMTLADFKQLTDSFASKAHSLYVQNRDHYMAEPDATPYLGSASKTVYTFIRRRLGVPFASEAGLEAGNLAFGTAVQSPIYAAIRSGAFWPVESECFRKAESANRVRT